MDDKQNPQESVETPKTSPVEKQTPDESKSVSGESQPAEGSEEEADNVHSGAQARIRKLIQERDDAYNKLAKQAQVDYGSVAQPTYQAPAPANPTADVDQAYDTLRQRGMATTQEVNAMMAQIMRNQSHTQLESEHNGSDGLPKYDRTEVEDHMKRENIGNPRAAFRDMYYDEHMDAQRVTKKRKTYSEKPSAPASNREQPETAESFRTKLSGPKGREYYEKLRKNPEAMDALVKQLSQQ